MIPCPNCGATARNGAKFCTTCGTRLGGVTPVPAPVASRATSDDEPTPPNTTSTWPWATASDEAETIAPATAEPAKTTADWDWPAPFSASATTAIAPDSPSSDHEAVGPDSFAEADASTPVESTPSPSEHEELSAWAAQWSLDPAQDDGGTESTDVVADVDDGPSTDIPGDPSAIETAVAVATADSIDASSPTGSLAQADEHMGAVDMASTSQGAPADRSGLPSASEDVPEPNDAPFDSVSELPASGNDAPVVAPWSETDVPANPPTPILAASNAHRATELLDELRALLTSGDEAPESSDLPTPIASALRHALGAETSFDALQVAASQADAHPRDLYALMELGRQSTQILTLLAERDRLRATITDLLGTTTASES